MIVSNSSETIKEEPITVEEVAVGEDETSEIEQANDEPVEGGALFKLEALNTVYIRSTTDTSDKHNRIGIVRPGDYFAVYETKESDGYTWNRIGKDKWVADDGSFFVKTEREFPVINIDLLDLEIPKKIERNHWHAFTGYVSGEKYYENFYFDLDGNFTYMTNYDEQKRDFYYPNYFLSDICHGSGIEKTTDNNGLVTKSVYNGDLDNDLYVMIYDLTFQYDENGRLIKSENIDSEGKLRSGFDYHYDNKGRLTQFDYSSDYVYCAFEAGEKTGRNSESGFVEYNGNLIFVDNHGRSGCTWSFSQIYRIVDNRVDEVIEQLDGSVDQKYIY